MTDSGSREQLCRELGIMSQYRTHAGEIRRAPVQTLEALIERLQAPVMGTPFPATLIHQIGGEPPIIPVHRLHETKEPLCWEVEAEGGERFNGDVDGKTGTLHTSEQFPIGDHRLRIRPRSGGAVIAEYRLIVAPRSAFLPPSLHGEGRLWGFAVQLFSLRSARNWGIGDFTDLLDLIDCAAGVGAGLIGLNPLHALFPDQPDWASPYSPSSRRFLNFLYLDLEALPEFAECQAAPRLRRDPTFERKLAALRAAPLVDYAGVAEVKRKMLTLLFEHFRQCHMAAEDAYAQNFREFQLEHSPDLRRFAIFHAMQEHFQALSPDLRSWHRWPKTFRDPDGAGVFEFARTHESQVEFFEYQQWHAHRQLQHCAERTREVGMPIGLYQDIAVGVDRDSAEAWSSQDYLVDGWSIGAPPDSWNPNGQNWGTPPPHPQRMRDTAYTALRQVLSANMRTAGAVRIDHILGLMRLFWIPQAAAADDGAYICYPLKDLLAVIALESQCHRCLVVGEDLGTVPEGLREALSASGILSYRLLYFERDESGDFRKPADWPAQALAAATTHDLPTLPGYWAGADIDLRARLNLYSSGDKEKTERKQRDIARQRLLATLQAEGLVAPSDDMASVESLYRYLARTPSKILMLHFEDALGMMGQMNVPGTTDQYPNWRQKLPMSAADLMSDVRVTRVVAAIKQERDGIARTDGRQSRHE